MAMKEGQRYNSQEIGKLEASRTISDGEMLKTGAHYVIDEKTGEKRLISTDEQIKFIRTSVEELLGKNLLTPENLKSGEFEISFEEDEGIGYEFELEKEQRIMVSPEDYEIKNWKNHVIDVYDQSGRCRIREKNGEPRLSIKVPLLSKDGDRHKFCIRLEFKPKTKKQTEELLKARELILQEAKIEIREKWGTPIPLSDGKKHWINKDDRGDYWIETDEETHIEDLLPEGIVYLGHSKSQIPIEKHATDRDRVEELVDMGIVKRNAGDADIFKKVFKKNIGSTSRTTKGIVDTSVSAEKKAAGISKEKIAYQMKLNEEKLIELLWNEKSRELRTPEDVERLLKEITGASQAGISKVDPYAFRTWSVDYNELSPEAVLEAMRNFYVKFLENISRVKSGTLLPADFARWVEYEIERAIHPLADGCGRLAKSLSAFVLARFSYPLPEYGMREDYYKTLNETGEEGFKEYYKKAILRSINENYIR